MAIVKRNPSMVEWLLSNEHLEYYRRTLLTATATGDFFRMWINFLVSFISHKHF